MRKGILFTFISIFFLFSCGPVDTTGSWQKVSGDNITLSGDLDSPQIDWEGGSATSLSVMDEDGNVVWYIGSGDLTSSSTFDPPVTYGKTPDGIQENGTAEELESDVEYTIVINIPYLSSNKTSLTATWIYK